MSNIEMHSGSRFFVVWMLSTFISFSLLFISLGIFDASIVTLSKFLACVLVGATIGLLTASLFGATGRFTFDLKHPATIYSIFYFLYYVLPYIGLLFKDEFQSEDESHIALIILVGAIFWQIGMYGAVRNMRAYGGRVITERAALALLAVLVFAACIVIYGFVWRVQTGIFFNQAQYHELALTVTDSLRGVLASQLQLPIITLLGMLAGLNIRRLASVPKYFLIGYGISVVLVLMFSSQTRPAITALLFMVLGYGLGGAMKWNAKLISALALSSILIVVIVQGYRVTQRAEFASSSNQFIYAVENIFDSTNQLLGSAENRSLMMDAVGSRAAGSIEFLGSVVHGVDARGQPFWGEGIFEGLSSLVPRVFWPDKPNVVPMQIAMQKLLGFAELYDAAPGPLIQFYFEGGLFGIAIGYLAFGWCVGWLTKRTFETGAIGWWMCLAFMWSTVANLEQELVFGFFGAIRSAFLMYGIWFLLTLFSKAKWRAAGVGR